MEFFAPVERISKFGQSFFDPKLVKFGPGNPKIEEECDMINAFMVCCGHTLVERRREKLDRNTTLRDTMVQFGRPMKQSLIADENYFIFNNKDLDRPLWMFSNKCNINLMFMFESHLKEVKDKIQLK